MDMHKDQDEARVVFHIGIPDTANANAMSYRAALVEYLTETGQGTTSTIPNLDGAEQTQMDAGEVFEDVQRIHFDTNLSNTDKRTAIETAYTARKTLILDRARDRLEFWGISGDVA